MVDIVYAEETGKSHGVLVQARPNIRTAKEKIMEYEIPGREAPLTERSGIYANVEFPVELGYRTDPEQWAEQYRSCTRWLRGTGILKFTDDPLVFRRVISVTIGEDVRESLRIGKFTATFLCSPGEYYAAGSQFLTVSEVLNNPYSFCRPIYSIQGEGICTLQVNGKNMKANVGQNLTIDTELRLAYRKDGTITNTAVAGDYEDLALIPGKNTITITTGFTLLVKPNWRSL